VAWRDAVACRTHEKRMNDDIRERERERERGKKEEKKVERLGID
jgi:hypothetical protein